MNHLQLQHQVLTLQELIDLDLSCSRELLDGQFELDGRVLSLFQAGAQELEVTLMFLANNPIHLFRVGTSFFAVYHTWMLDDEYDMFFADLVCSPSLPMTKPQFHALAPRMAKYMADSIPDELWRFTPDPLRMADAHRNFSLVDTARRGFELNEEHRVALMRENPVVKLSTDSTWDSYLSSLDSKRRYKVKQALKEVSTRGYTLHTGNLTDDRLMPEIIGWCATNYPNENGYHQDAYAQLLHVYGAAVEAVYPEHAMTFVLSGSEGPVAVGTFLHRRQTHGDGYWYFHSFASKPGAANIGAQFLASCIKWFTENGNPVRTLDVTYGYTIHIDPSFVYKRVVCNAVDYNDVLFFGPERPDYISPPYFDCDAQGEGEWVLSSKLPVISGADTFEEFPIDYDEED